MRYALCAVVLSLSVVAFGDPLEIPDCSKTFLNEVLPRMKEVVSNLKPKEESPSSERRMREVAGYHFQPACLEFGKLQSLMRVIKNGVVSVKLTPVQEDAFEQMEKAVKLERCEGKPDSNPDAGAFTDAQSRLRKLQRSFIDFETSVEDASGDLEKKFCKSQLQWEAIDIADRNLASAQDLLKKIPNYDGQMGYDQGAAFCGLVGKAHAATKLALSVTTELNVGDDSYGPEDKGASRLTESLEALKPFAEERCTKNIKVGNGDKAFDAVAIAGRRVEMAATNLSYERQERLSNLRRSLGKETSIMDNYGFPHQLSRQSNQASSSSHD